MTAAVIVALRVAASPARAFDAFTADIGRWWVPSALFRLTAQGDGRLRFEPGEGGRLIADFDDGAEFEVGRVTVWAPGERLALSWRQASFAPDEATELEVRFEAVGDMTRVTVEHRGWDRLPPAHAARHGAALMVFQQRQAEHWRVLLGALARAVAGAGE